MKILFLSTLPCAHLWGGSEELWAQSALELAKRGHEVTIALYKKHSLPPQIQKLSDSGCQLRWLEDCQTRHIALRVIAKIINGIGLRSPPALANILQSVRPDLLVNSLPYHTYGAAESAICGQLGVPYVLIVQAASLRDSIADADIPSLIHSYTNARQIYFVSNRNLQEVQTQLAVELPRSRVVRNPFNVRFETSPTWPSQTATAKFACVARLEPYAKGQDILFDVMRRPHWQNRELTISLYGSGVNETQLRRLAKLWNIEHKIQFCGYSHDIESLWREHHALVLPSRLEGLPLALVEGMLCHRFAIVTDVAGNAELIADEQTGFIAKAPTADLLDDAMERAWRRRRDWQTIGLAAGKSVRAVIPADPINEFVALLTELTNQDR